MPSSLFGSDGQYLTAVGIDPDVPASDSASDVKTAGIIRPVNYEQFSSTEINAAPIKILNNPKDNLTWVILSNGKVVVYTSALTSAASQTIGTVAGSNATGCFYLNNYIYILGTGSSKDDVSRVGPLNTLPYDGQTGNFTVGLVVTGGTSGATARIVADNDAGATGTLTLANITGIFLDNETITDTSTGSATVNRALSSLITDNVWKGATLGSQTALTNSSYPVTLFSTGYLNHFGINHIDGAGYFLDFKDGVGMVHMINTKKGTYQGDTNDTTRPSAYNVLDLPFDFLPLVLSSYGNDLVLSGTFTADSNINQGNAFLFFFNPADSTPSFYRRVPLPDPICTVLKYDNGILYGISGHLTGGYRIWRYVGGDSIETLAIVEDAYPPLQEASAYIGNRLVWGANITYPINASGLFAYGSKSDLFRKGLHNIAISGFQS